MVFTAKYPGRCDDCREAILPGQMVEHKGVDRKLVHEVCDESPTEPDPNARREVCRVCRLEKPCVCEVPF